jgi:hypothetical protein
MVTLYKISVGYISGDTWKSGKDEAIKELFATTHKYISSRKFLSDVRKRIGVIYQHEQVSAYAQQYRTKHGNPLTYDHREQAIYISCSGGGNSRYLKEMIAMLFCAYIASEMATLGIPVNLTVS